MKKIAFLDMHYLSHMLPELLLIAVLIILFFVIPRKRGEEVKENTAHPEPMETNEIESPENDFYPDQSF